ncbi:hypothetical protein JCM33374_g5388 [Metschnikowia sp. JCM 33374]|nr:hypothetical protein JCM33374_g5388 [Metschnikowia sp. JCM 33374]
MTLKKKLLISVGSIQSQDLTVPVNTGNFVDISTDIGVFSVSVFIRNFDGSNKHLNNSLYNVVDKTYLNGISVQESSLTSYSELPNLRILINFKPKSDLNGSELFFGNECSIPVKDYVPTTLLSTGLRFFKWFLNPTIESDLYGDRPYIYGLALNSFSKLGIANSSVPEFVKNEEENITWESKPPGPTLSLERRKFFCNVENSKKFRYDKSLKYYMMFDTNFLKLGDSNYNVSIPAIGKQTFDVNVLRFANEKLDNINWVIKKSDNGNLTEGSYGLVLNFRLVEEEGAIQHT